MKNKLFSNQRSVLRATTVALFMLVVVFVFGTAISSALALETGIQYGTITGLGTQDIRISIMKIVRIALGFVGVIALAVIIYAGFVWTTSAGNPERIDFAKRTLRNAAIGLVIIFMSFSIVSFLIGSLGDIFGEGNQPPSGPPGPCDTCGHLGNGIIESVFPTPNAQNVARNTNIMVTFKVPMDPSTIIDDTNGNDIYGDCTTSCDTLNSGSVLIYEDSLGEDAAIDASDVVVQTIDNKTFVFNPAEFLGDGVNNVLYATKLTDDIEKDNGQPAFQGGFGSNFTWRYEIGTQVDLDPVEHQSVFPQPDNSGDNYSQSLGAGATTLVSVTAIPNVFAESSVSVTRLAPPSDGSSPETAATVNGSYNGVYRGSLDVTFTDSDSVTLDWSPARTACPGDNCHSNFPDGSYDLAGGVLTLGEGVSLSFANTSSGNQWNFNFVPFTTADNVRIANRTYVFVDSINPSASEIQRGSTPAEHANNIVQKVNNDTQSPNVNASIPNSEDAPTEIEFSADLLGDAGNSITFTSAGAWLAPRSGRLSGGSDSSLTNAVNGLPDKPRNAVIQLIFNEAVDPVRATDGTSVQIQYDTDPDPGIDNWTTVSGQYFISNQYRTLEFLSDSQCGVCSAGPVGNACSTDADCGGIANSCESVANSCGDTLYCLPTLPDGDTSTSDEYDATQYRVVINAGLIEDCSANGCSDSNYSQCIATPGADTGLICADQNPYDTDNNFFAPTSRLGVSGITDISNNSFNGNSNTYTLRGIVLGNAEGPNSQSNQPAFSLNTEAVNTGDDLTWSFYINKTVDLSPPHISQAGPNVGLTGASLTAPIESTFDELMFSSTLKPGSGYQDGLCGCTQDSDCNTSEGEFCDLDFALVQGIYGKCKNVDLAAQEFCAENSQCGGDELCINRKYLSLIDRSSSPSGWWVTSQGFDLAPQDGFSDITRGQIQHTRLNAITNYGGEVGSGVKDMYQNCFLPSQGPDGTQGLCSISGESCATNLDCGIAGERCESVSRCQVNTLIICTVNADCPGADICQGVCPVTESAPYCCNGSALNQADWEGSTCFTGF